MEGVRSAEPGDLSRLGELLGQAVAATPKSRGGYLFGLPERNTEITDRLTVALEAEDRSLLCGTVDGYVVGFVLVSAPGPTAVIQELYVEPDARHVGVGQALVDAAISWCQQRGCTGVDLAALPGDRQTKNLAERTGFSARSIWMHKAL